MVEKIKSLFKGKDVLLILNLPKLYAVSAIPAGKNPDDYEDTFYGVDKQSMKIIPFNPSMDIENFKMAMRDPLYKLSK